MTAPAAPSTPKTRSKGKILLAIIVVIVIVILVIPVALAGAFTVPLATVTFDETTGSLTASNIRLTNQVVTAYEYYYSIRTQGMLRTSDSNVSTSRGTTNITITMMLTNPSNQTIDLGKTSINGGLGTRTHTIYLSIDQGVRANGEYRFDITVTASVAPVGGLLQINLSTTIHSNWVVIGH